MEFISTIHEVNHAQVDVLIELTECLIAIRERLKQDPQRRSACVKLYEGTCEPTEHFGMLGINHAEGELAQVTLLTIPPDAVTMRNIVNHVFRDWDHLESFLGDQNGWIFHPSSTTTR
jgi:hypothetical protein